MLEAAADGSVNVYGRRVRSVSEAGGSDGGRRRRKRRWGGKGGGRTLREIKYRGMSEDAVFFMCVCLQMCRCMCVFVFVFECVFVLVCHGGRLWTTFRSRLAIHYGLVVAGRPRFYYLWNLSLMDM